MGEAHTLGLYVTPRPLAPGLAQASVGWGYLHQARLGISLYYRGAAPIVAFNMGFAHINTAFRLRILKCAI